MATEYCRLFEADIDEVSLVKRSRGEINELKAARGAGLLPEHTLDNYIWCTDGDWHGFSGNLQPDVKAPYIVCPVHTKEAWDKYQASQEQDKEVEEDTGGIF